MMKKRLSAACLLLALALLSCQCNRLTVMTYNVGVFSKYAESSIPGVAEAIHCSGATLVGLNELDSCNRRHPQFQLKALAHEMGAWDYLFASAFPFAGGGYGNGVLSARPMLASWRLALPKGDGSEPRSVAVMETADCIFASTHLEFSSPAAALAQARVINDWFTAHFADSKKPVLLCGDMNAAPDSPVIALLENCWERLSGTAFTYSTEDPHACLDYVFALRSARPVRVDACEVLTTGTASLSDHYPLVLRLRY